VSGYFTPVWGLGLRIFSLLAAACSPAVVPAVAIAGGYDTGETDWDFLFQNQGNVAVEAATRYINPQRDLTNITGALGPTINVDETAPFSVQRFSIAVRLGESVRCMGSYREPWAGEADYGSAWTYSFSAITQSFTSEDFGLTCGVSMALEKGKLTLLGGVSRQEINYVLTQTTPIVGGVSTTDVSDEETAYRIGLAYEIPEYALRASVIYNSQVDYDMTDTLSFSAIPGPPLSIFGSISMPQSVEAKFQSGVAPGWLIFGSAKWTDWSVADNMPLCAVGVSPCTQAAAVSGLTLLFQDTWTVTLGAAHQFNEYFSVAGNVTWDQGATRGFTSQTDTWVAGLTAILTPGNGMELKFGGTAGIMTGGNLSTLVLPGGIPNPFGYTATFGDDYVYTLNASAVFRF
jgi:long-chain fatty acid transport protein